MRVWRTSEKKYAVPERRYRPGMLFLRERWALLVIMLLGAALRFYGLGLQPLWGDELESWDFSNRDTLSQVIEGVRSDHHPPLYFLILHFTQSFLSDTEWALRLPSALAGWLCIPAIYALGRRIYSEREGLIAALFLAVLWVPVYYSQEARSYSMLILLSILTSYFWWGVMLGLRHRGELPLREATWYAICAVLCAYLHYFGLLLVVLQGVTLAVLAYRALRNVMFMYAPVVLAYALWLPSMIYQLQYGERPRIGEPTLFDLPDHFQYLFDRSGLLSLAAWTLISFLLIRGWDDLRPRRKGSGIPPGLLLAAWALGPFIVAYAVSQSSVQVLTEKNLLISLPAVYLLLARSITRAFSGKAAAIFQGTVAVGLAAACLAYLIFAMDYYTNPTKEQIRGAASYVVNHEGSDTLVVRCDEGDRLDYYLETRKSGSRDDVEACEAKDFPRIQERVKEGDYHEVFHLITSTDPDPQLVSLLQRNFQPVDYKRFSGTAVVVYKARKPAPSGMPQPEPPASLPKHE